MTPRPNLTRDQILARKTGRGRATLADGSTVGIRALTRDEVLEMQGIEHFGERDNFLIATGMTDPKMSIADVAEWAKQGDAGDLVDVSDAIAVISHLKPESGKSGVAAPGRRSGA